MESRWVNRTTERLGHLISDQIELVFTEISCPCGSLTLCIVLKVADSVDVHISVVILLSIGGAEFSHK